MIRASFDKQRVLLALILMLCLPVHPVLGQKLYIFIPSEYKPVKMEASFARMYPNLTVRAFGSNIDFKKSVAADNPDAIITKPPLLDQISGYTIKLKAFSNGSAEEPFVLLSVDKQITMKDLGGKSIGILDFLGKKETEEFVMDVAGVLPALKRVKKTADLLPLLTMNMVDGVIVTAGQARYLKQRSNLDYLEIKCSGSSGIAVLAVARDDVLVVNAVKKMPEELTILLGVDSWK